MSTYKGIADANEAIVANGWYAAPSGATVQIGAAVAATRRLHDEGAGDVAVLNFASARNAGGGYLGGARAQEEDLCRISALYTTLRQAPDYYAAHRASKDPAYSHRVIYSPDVPVYRDVRYRLLEAPYQVAFLTSPAPNAGVIARLRPADTAAFQRHLSADGCFAGVFDRIVFAVLDKSPSQSNLATFRAAFDAAA